MSVELIGPNGITPRFVLEESAKTIDKTRGIVIVEFYTDGEHAIECSCTRAELAMAICLLQTFFIRGDSE